MINTAVTPPVALGAVRTYTFGGSAFAVKSTVPGGGTDYVFGDPNGTSTLSMDVTTQQLSRQEYKPYGELRSSGGALAWPDSTHGYLGKSKESGTGYTDLGARKYDPSLGSFISADPLLETTDPNQLGGYTYSGDDPTGASDPSGLSPARDEIPTSVCYSACEQAIKNQQGVTETENSDGSSTVDGVRVEKGRVTNKAKFLQYVNQFYNSSLAAKQPDETSRLLLAMSLACQYAGANGKESSQCTAAFARETYTAAALRAQYNNGCRGKCLENYEKIMQAADVLMSQALVEGSQDGIAKAVDAADSLTGEGQLAALSEGSSIGCLGGNSFAADTPVVMADGTTKPIKDVKVGDKVLTTDPVTGQTAERAVTATHLNHDNDLATLIVKDTHGHQSKIHTTENHPFWDDTRQAWVDAGKLHSGDRLHDKGGAPLTVVVAVPMIGAQDMYNLTVAADHTYYVMAGNTLVLVHNDSGAWTPSAATKVMRGGPFGATYYQMPPDRLGNVYWWSSDIAGHGNSKWKIFTESKVGLDWYADADKNGTYIEGKHKGGTGLTVSFKNLKSVNVTPRAAC